MANLGKGVEKIESLKDEEFEIFGITMTPAVLAAVAAALSTIVGGLYGGFVLYQKIESVAGLDLGEYQQKMEVMDAKVEESLKYAKDIKDGLRSDIMRLERSVERNTEKTDRQEEKVRSMLDSADARFESRREQLRQSQKADMKELEDRLNAKVQRALDNPLAK
jgi:dGTP triphosphohydrolase